MDQNGINAEWIVAYLEWSGAGEATDIQRYADTRAAGEDGGARFALAYLEWIDAGQAAAEAAAREAVLLSALRAEYECMRILRGAIAELHGVRSAGSHIEGQAAIEAVWPDAPEGLAADVRALTGSVLALQAH